MATFGHGAAGLRRDMTRRGVLSFAAGAAIVSLGGCGRGTQTFRYRLTVDIATPDGLRSGTAVQELEHGGTVPWLPGGDSYTTAIHGDAVAVDLPGDTLFMLMKIDSDRLLSEAFRAGTIVPPIDAGVDRTWPQNRVALMRAALRVQAKLIIDAARPPEYALRSVPWLKFRDAADPKSHEQVDPEHLAASFGAGVALKQIVIAFTQDELTRQIDKRLVWVDDLAKYEKHPGAIGSGSLPKMLYGLRN